MLRNVPVATISLVFVTAFLFYAWSGGFLFSPSLEVARQYGLDIRSPVSYLTYPFVHLWPLHLFSNLLFVLVFGGMVERELGARKFVLFYVISAAMVGVFSQLADIILKNPAATIAGASGVAFALVGASLVVKPVRTMAVFLLLSYVVVPVFLSGGISQAQGHAAEESTLNIALIEQNKSSLLARLEAGNITQEDFNRTYSVIEERRHKESERLSGIEASKSREATPIAESAHASAPFAGAALMLVFRPSALGGWAARGRWMEGKLRAAQKSIYKDKQKPSL